MAENNKTWYVRIETTSNTGNVLLKAHVDHWDPFLAVIDAMEQHHLKRTEIERFSVELIEFDDGV